MDAVGDVIHRVFGRLDLRPEMAADVGRDVAVNARDAVVVARAAQREGGHVEIGLARFGAERHQLLPGKAEVVAPAREIMANHLRREVIMPGRDGRVRGEHEVGGDGLERGGIGHALADHAVHALENQEGGMAFVDVPDRRVQAERGEGARAADAEQDFLLDARRPVAAVEAVGDFAVAFRVLRQPGIEQDEPDMADADFPDLGMHGPAGKGDLDQDVFALRVENRGNRQVVEVGIVVDRLLLTVAIQRLLEIALAIEQADADEGQAHVAGRLAVVAGKDAEAAGVDRQAFVETEFGAEVGDQVVLLERVPMHVRHARHLVVGVVGRQDAVQGAEENRRFGNRFQFFLVGALEEGLGIVIARPPQRRREADEQAARRTVPAVPQVVGEFLETGEPFRDLRIDFEFVDGSGHGGVGSMVSCSCRVQASSGMTQLMLSSTACMIFSKPASDCETVCCGRP